MGKTCDQNPKENHLHLQEKKGRYFSYKFKYWLGWALTTGLLIELTDVEVEPVCLIAFVDFWPSADFYNRPNIDDVETKLMTQTKDKRMILTFIDTSSDKRFFFFCLLPP